MYQLSYKHITFEFKIPGGTSRGVLHEKDSWFLIISDTQKGVTGIGECSIINGLSPDDISQLDSKIRKLALLIQSDGKPDSEFFTDFPALKFAYEMAMLDLQNGGKRILFNNDFVDGHGIPINGLIWMGSTSFMLSQIKEKIKKGFKCLKLKIGALDFDEEIEIIRTIRKEFNKHDIELRVDANGAFSTQSALEKLQRLSQFDLHSIEQPIAVRQWEEMARLAELSPLPIALDEELIRVKPNDQEELLKTIKPDYIILKPSLLGGFKASEAWINESKKLNIKWWVTSALESNIGLNAIAQWTYGLNTDMYQGLGTGQLYTNNIVSPLDIINARLVYTKYDWDLDQLFD